MSIKCSNMMYTQQTAQLPRPPDEIFDRLLKAGVDKVAMITHDKDVNTAEHIHIMMSSQNARHITSIANIIGDKPQYVEHWKGSANNGFSYLIHQTDNSKHKFQYDESEVTANFDFPALMRRTRAKVKKQNEDDKIKNLLDSFKAGYVTKEEVEDTLTGSEYGSLKSRIENIYVYRMQEEAKQWRKEALEQGKTIKLIWIFGKAGTGKSRLAKAYAKKLKCSYYITKTSRDLFQSYKGEHTIIIDDIRSGNLQYEDLLSLTDPFGIENGVYAPCRYHDKPVMADTFIVTSPLSPYIFYKRTVCASDERVDGFDQIERRINLILYMDMDSIIPATYTKCTDDIRYETFNLVLDDANKKDNPYSSANAVPIIDSQQLFNDMTS